MAEQILVSTAYLPPIEYISVIAGAGEVCIEKEENYMKQTYRNRCYILSSHGPQLLSVPVYQGSLHKTPVKDIRIDYSKRWQQVHLRALAASYKASPYFEYYYEDLEKIISSNTGFLLDLNTELTGTILELLKISTKIAYTTEFTDVGNAENDFRYSISPKIKSGFHHTEYIQVFSANQGFTPNLSIVDLLFNKGPESVKYL